MRSAWWSLDGNSGAEEVLNALCRFELPFPLIVPFSEGRPGRIQIPLSNNNSMFHQYTSSINNFMFQFWAEIRCQFPVIVPFPDLGRINIPFPLIIPCS